MFFASDNQALLEKDVTLILPSGTDLSLVPHVLLWLAYIRHARQTVYGASLCLLTCLSSCFPGLIFMLHKLILHDLIVLIVQVILLSTIGLPWPAFLCLVSSSELNRLETAVKRIECFLVNWNFVSILILSLHINFVGFRSFNNLVKVVLSALQALPWKLDFHRLHYVLACNNMLWMMLDDATVLLIELYLLLSLPARQEPWSVWFIACVLVKYLLEVNKVLSMFVSLSCVI